MKKNEDEEWKDISEDAKDLIRKLLERDQKKRISAKEAFNHKWFLTSNDAKIPLNKKIMQNLTGFNVNFYFLPKKNKIRAN